MDSEVIKTYKENEYLRNYMPYNAYFQAISDVFDFSIIDSFADLGCNNGGLLYSIKKQHKDIDLIGYDYFEWSKTYADKSIQNVITIGDLSKKISFPKKYSMVNCSEVGEHIPRECESVFLDNLANITEDILILTWSNEYDDEGQHLNPRPKNYIIDEMRKRGFALWEDTTNKLSGKLANNLEGIGYNWWADNIMIFKKERFAKIDSSYFLQKISSDNVNHKIYLTKKGLTKTSLQEEFGFLTKTILLNSIAKKSISILRVGDGDYYFLRQIPIGSAKPGKRSLTKSYNQIPIDIFRKFFWQNDIISTSLERHDRKKFLAFISIEFFEKIYELVFKNKKIIFTNGKIKYALDKITIHFFCLRPVSTFIAWIYSFKRGDIYYNKAKKIINNEEIHLETIYSLISTKWIFKNFPNKIGIIASENKINIIKQLLQKEEYQNYLGLQKFSDYISIPEKGAADNIENLIKEVGEKVSKSEAEVFLIGAGSAKIALIPSLKYYKNAIFIDVGGGIDAIAGIMCQSRPYFAEWVNYKLSDFDYSKIDLMDVGNPDWNNQEYKTTILKYDNIK